MSNSKNLNGISRVKKRMNTTPKSIGPVSNLEEHVPPDWWNRIFNSLYLKTDADVIDDQEITRIETDMIIELLKLNPEDKILDLCCGQGRHTLELARRGFRNLDGLDRSHYLIQKARDVAKSDGLNPKFKEGDARKLPFQPDTFDTVLILGNSFGYFETLNDDLQVLKEVHNVLKPWGKILIDITDGEYVKKNYQSRSWEWINKQMFVCRERSLSIDGDRLVSREVINHVSKGVIADQFYAERLYSRSSLSRLFEEASFSDVAFPRSFSPDSQRNQDLGMMEQRIIVTANIRKEWTVVKTHPKKTEKTIAVIFGDPRKPDMLKPDNIFDDDDFYTIDSLKDALREIDGYRFEYLDNHDTLIRDLIRISPKVDLVLNLCDEGFYNDPKKEMHVPVILEMLGIPYTGAGPQCISYCYDKSLVRGVAKEMGIPVPEAIFVRPEDSTFEMPFELPGLVKPNLGDSSFGITQKSVVHTGEDLINAINSIRQGFGYNEPILVEEFLAGKDLTVGILGAPPSSYVVLPISEEDYSSLPKGLPRICGYEAKWQENSPYWQIKAKPAELPKDTEQAIVEWCVALSERLGCRDYTRFDWRLDSSGNPKLLEVNPNPGWCWDSHLVKMAKFAKMSYSDVLNHIISAAFERLGIEKSKYTKDNYNEAAGEIQDSKKTILVTTN
jgi:D-alanine-D-alanine ligase